MFCSQCGTETKADSQFCHQCGRQLAALVVAPDQEPLPAGGRAGPSWSGQSQIVAPGMRGEPARQVATGRIVTFEAGSAEIGGLGRRLSSLLIDLAFSIVAIMGVMIAVGIGYFIANGIPEDEAIPASDEEAIGFLIWALALPLVFVGTWVFNSTGGTVGKRILGLRIVRADLEAPGFIWGLARTFGAWLSWAPLGLGFLWATWDDNAQTWHDKMTGTYVVRADSFVVPPSADAVGPSLH